MRRSKCIYIEQNNYSLIVILYSISYTNFNFMFHLYYSPFASLGLGGQLVFIFFLILALVDEVPGRSMPSVQNLSNHENHGSGESYRSGGHSDPSFGLLPIMDIGRDCILGQIDSSISDNISTSQLSTTSTIRAKLDGPIRCGPGQPCAGGSCCNRSGKCGFTKAHCARAVCISNCNATAICGIDSEDHKTKCGLGLCCSYYGWCGFESAHCKDPEPQFGQVSSQPITKSS
jgi:hypothetical protein